MRDKTGRVAAPELLAPAALDGPAPVDGTPVTMATINAPRPFGFGGGGAGFELNGLSGFTGSVPGLFTANIKQPFSSMRTISMVLPVS